MTFKLLAFAALIAAVVAQEHKGHATSYASLSFYPTSHGQSGQATHYAAPAVAHYAAAPAVAHYAAAPAVAHYASAPAVAHYASAPAVAHYAAPAVHYAAPEAHAVKSLAVPVYHKAVVPVKAVEYHHEEEPSAPAHYIFKYAVHDEHTHDIKEQEEKREGDKVEGFYSLIEPDGSKRTVHYTADKHSGFNAVVQREHNVHAPAPVQKKIAVAAVPVHKYVAAAPVYHAEQASHAPVYHAAPVYQTVKVAAAPVYQAVKVAAAPVVSYHSAPAPAAHSGHGEATSYISFSGPVAPAHH